MTFNPESFICSKVKSMKPSGIRKFFDIVNTMEDAISLGVGEPDFVTPWHIRDAGIYSLEKGHTYYTSNAGLKELREEICNYYKKFDINCTSDEVLVTVGGSEAIDLAIRTVIEPGDEVIIHEPSFVCYKPCISLAGGVPVVIETKKEDAFRVTAKDIEKNITPKTKMLILSFPNNPTGAIMRKEDLEPIADLAIKHNLIVLSDEIYAELTYDAKHFSIASLDGMKERTIVVNGFSKAFAMTGWRLGFAMANKEILKAMTKIHQYAIMSSPTTSQYSAIEALRNGADSIRMMVSEYNKRRKIITNGFNEMGLTCFDPKGAFYIFPSIKSTNMTSTEFCENLLRDQKVALVPGNAFGDSGEGFVRVSYAYSLEQINEAMRRIKLFMDKI
ncbi:MAG: aminotransferase class I/II-fold pyridoxal phosphate-dependent enzyme [Ruminococcaceae bacterium]|nr:aminotransferase class I/II-fold pyridoxal phosphate-dependent enzyme [Oscillospiraceae bacterium]